MPQPIKLSKLPMKPTAAFLLLILLPVFSFSQNIDSVLLGSNNYQVGLGDELVVGLPAGGNDHFLFIFSDTTKAQATSGNFAESAVDLTDIRSASIEEMSKNPALQYRDKDVDASQLGSIWIRGKNPLTSKILRIVQLEEYRDNKGVKHSYAIGVTDTNERFRVELEKAIYSGELSTHNGKMFENFVVRMGFFEWVE